MDQMLEVTVIQSGGFAGLIRTYKVSAATLDSKDRERLEQLVAGLARCRPEAAPAGQPQPDRFQFDVEVCTAKGKASYRFAEDRTPAELKALIDWVKQARR